MQRPAALILLVLASLAGLTLAAPAPPVMAADPEYPSEDLLRRLQLDIIACGRDNRREDCEKARTGTDPMLDNPLLSGSCKDVLWLIGQKAVVVATNDFVRRDELTAAANDMVQFCRRQTMTVKPAAPSPAGGSGRRSGFGLVPGS